MLGSNFLRTPHPKRIVETVVKLVSVLIKLFPLSFLRRTASNIPPAATQDGACSNISNICYFYVRLTTRKHITVNTDFIIMYIVIFMLHGIAYSFKHKYRLHIHFIISLLDYRIQISKD